MTKALGEVRRADLPAEHARSPMLVSGPPGCRSDHLAKGGSPSPLTPPHGPFLLAFRTLRALPPRAWLHVSRICSLIGVLPWFAGCPAVPPVWMDASRSHVSPRALDWLRMRDAWL
jgi:hypothetical protein